VEPQASVALLHAREPEESILLIRRATNPNDPWSGHWSFPGGHRDETDGDLLDTALRELHEECGVELTRDHLHQTLEPMTAGRRVGKTIMVAPFVFDIPRTLPVTLAATEAVESIWAPVSMLGDLSLHKYVTVPGLPEDMRFPALDLNGVPLWGFTYRVVCEWIGVDIPLES
jgi:8-oxo-dGTP pyrophosphatase MutT (NUDIX family)